MIQTMQTSPDQVARQATDALANSSVRDLRGIHVGGDEHTLELTGRVRSFYHKQLAQEAVKTVAGDLRINNCLAVRAK